MTPQTELTVRKTVTVNVPQAHAFDVFAKRMHAWWPMATHHIAKVAAETVIVEPREGGRWYERGVDGSECLWGSVLAWDPPNRLMLSWQLNADWQFDPNLVTEVDVRFIAESPTSTRVDFEHRNLERLGDKAAAVRDAIDSEGGWTGILRLFAEEATRG